MPFLILLHHLLHHPLCHCPHSLLNHLCRLHLCCLLCHCHHLQLHQGGPRIASFTSTRCCRADCSSSTRAPPTGSATDSLCAVGGQSIPSWGQRMLPLSFSSTSNTTLWLEWSFTLATVDRPILCADFLGHHQFEVSLTRHLLVSMNGDVSLPLMSFSSTSLLSKISSAYQEILSEFLEIDGLRLALGPVKHDVCHHVETHGLPISTPARRLDPQKYAAM